MLCAPAPTTNNPFRQQSPHKTFIYHIPNMPYHTTVLEDCRLSYRLTVMLRIFLEALLC